MDWRLRPELVHCRFNNHLRCHRDWHTLEGVFGAFLVNRYARGRNAFYRAQDTFKFTFLAGMLSTAVSATFGVTSLSLGGFAPVANYGPIWLTWWLGDAASAVVLAPLLILWISDHHFSWNWIRFSEFATLMIAMVLVGQVVFCGLLLPPVTHYPLEYLGIPFHIWAHASYFISHSASVLDTRTSLDVAIGPSRSLI